jgi:hypothetical protein
VKKLRIYRNVLLSPVAGLTLGNRTDVTTFGKSCRTAGLIRWTIRQTDRKKERKKERTSCPEDILHEVQEMWEDLECDGEFNSNSNGDGTDRWLHTLKVTMMLKISWKSCRWVGWGDPEKGTSQTEEGRRIMGDGLEVAG